MQRGVKKNSSNYRGNGAGKQKKKGFSPKKTFTDTSMSVQINSRTARNDLSLLFFSESFPVPHTAWSVYFLNN